uniref:Uncharacterized protein n=1 Tax=Arundo donax TaxID=35708 RepID=A0A0A9TQY1_ARUDO
MSSELFLSHSFFFKSRKLFFDRLDELESCWNLVLELHVLAVAPLSVAIICTQFQSMLCLYLFSEDRCNNQNLVSVFFKLNIVQPYTVLFMWLSHLFLTILPLIHRPDNICCICLQ